LNRLFTQSKTLMRPVCHFANGREASSFSWSSHSSFELSYHIGWFAIVDVWDRSPLVVNVVSHGPCGEEVERPSPPCTLSTVGPERLLRFCLGSINSEVLNHPSCSLGLQQVSIESCPFPPLILKLTLLHCL
jgi:hypothetical protein